MNILDKLFVQIAVHDKFHLIIIKTQDNLIND